MNSLVEAINTKFEELNNGAIIGLLSSRASSASFRPSKILFMDGLGIKSIGDQGQLLDIAGHVEELDLSANCIESWKEVFFLLQSLPHLKSLNLSYNPLGQQYVPIYPSKSVVNNPINILDKSSKWARSGRKMSSDSAQGSSISSSQSTATNLADDSMDVASPSASLQEQNFWTCDSVEDLTVETIQLPEDLSPCKIALKNGLIEQTTTFPQLQALILNSTNIPWPWIIEIFDRCPGLSELHLALNAFGSETGHLDQHPDLDLSALSFPSLTSLFYSQNGPLEWRSVLAFHSIFPNLKHLVLLGNELSAIPAKDDQVKGPVLPKLKQLCLNDTQIHEWSSIDNLAVWTPSLQTLKLGLNLPLFEGLSKAECRNQVIARMPNLQIYNSLVITAQEREQAERDFLRHYGGFEAVNRPKKFAELERKHGVLEPLAVIDFTPKKSVRVRVEFQGRELWHELNTSYSVGQTKIELATLFGLCESSPGTELKANQMKHLRLFYYDQVMWQAQGPEELRYVTRKIHSLQPEDGDMFQLLCSSN